VSLEVRPTRDLDEFARAVYGIAQYFGAPPDEERLGRLAKALELERMHAAFEDDEIVGGAGAFTYDFSVPGGTLPCAGVTVVGVYPTHRRRGVLRAMMETQLRDVHERGEPIAALWASEETIYGRFGYGIAAWSGGVKIKREWSAFRAAGRTDRQDALRDADRGARALPAGVGCASRATSRRALAHEGLVGGPNAAAS